MPTIPFYSLFTGNILGATELQGPVNFHYNDLKSATKNFSEENKLGEGGFGDVYKVRWPVLVTAFALEASYYLFHIYTM